MSGCNKWRYSVYALFDPSFDLTPSKRKERFSIFLNLITLTLIVVSCVCFCMETLPKYVLHRPHAFFIIETVCVSWFTFDFLVRITTTPNVCKFCKDLLNWIDLISLIPYYIKLFMVQQEGAPQMGFFIVFRTIRLTRIFRVFRLSKYSTGIQLVTDSLKCSFDALTLLVFLLIIAVTLFSTGVYFTELMGNQWDDANKVWRKKGTTERAAFQSIPDTFWWCFVTITTTGYGDVVPETALGRVIAAATMVMGILVIAFPTILIGVNFEESYNCRKYRRQYEKNQGRVNCMSKLSREDLQAQLAIFKDHKLQLDDQIRLIEGTVKCLNEATTLIDMDKLASKIHDSLKQSSIHDMTLERHTTSMAVLQRVQNTIPPPDDGMSTWTHRKQSTTSSTNDKVTGGAPHRHSVAFQLPSGVDPHNQTSASSSTTDNNNTDNDQTSFSLHLVGRPPPPLLKRESSRTNTTTEDIPLNSNPLVSPSLASPTAVSSLGLATPTVGTVSPTVTNPLSNITSPNTHHASSSTTVPCIPTSSAPEYNPHASSSTNNLSPRDIMNDELQTGGSTKDINSIASVGSANNNIGRTTTGGSVCSDPPHPYLSRNSGNNNSHSSSSLRHTPNNTIFNSTLPCSGTLSSNAGSQASHTPPDAVSDGRRSYPASREGSMNVDGREEEVSVNGGATIPNSPHQ